MHVLQYKRVASTNTTARRHAENGKPEWTVVVSGSQSNGRGRQGATWQSPRGGLWFTIILRPIIPTESAPTIQFLAGNGLLNGIRAVTGLAPRVKWPNDILVDSKKLAGILVETKTSSAHIEYALIGIGLNLNLASNQIPSGAISTHMLLLRKLDPKHVLKKILQSIQSECDQPFNPERIMAQWWKNCIHRDKLVTIKRGKTSLSGRNSAIDNQGRLILDKPSRKPILVSEGSLQLSSTPTT
ncbi:MAG TPA: biotin--[acetyl-CoA-carboxylase] ligase [Candidatus Bathyarchaeia archaeon]|nr:biotin--[acetyl-CoA-carboxylase] ligase [Candidatus Bathyarchaeia archaeon]